jgi:BNR repeat protein
MLFALLLLAAQIVPATAELPNRQPRLSAQGNAVGVAYGAGNSILFAASSDDGSSFGPPVVVSSEGQLSLGMHRGPRVAYTPRGLVITAVVGEQGKGKDGDLIAWRSTDGGKTWSRPVPVNDVPGSAREGLHAMAFGGKATLFAAWLDLRAQGTRIYGAVSTDGGAAWSANRLVYESPSGTVCQCCHPSVAVSAEGIIHVLFRNALEGSRDLYVIRSEDGGKTFGAANHLGLGTWKLEGCPMDGGGLAVDGTGAVATVWRRDQTVFATEGDLLEKTLGAGRNPTVVSTRNGLFAAWTRGTSVLVRKPGSSQPEVVAEDGAFPALTALSDGSVALAWESKGAIEIRTVRWAPRAQRSSPRTKSMKERGRRRP